eukprot:3871155-Prymnesium_polylepis.1
MQERAPLIREAARKVQAASGRTSGSTRPSRPARRRRATAPSVGSAAPEESSMAVVAVATAEGCSTGLLAIPLRVARLR